MKTQTQHYYGYENAKDTHSDQAREVDHYKHLPQIPQINSIYEEYYYGVIFIYFEALSILQLQRNTYKPKYKRREVTAIDVNVTNCSK